MSTKQNINNSSQTQSKQRPIQGGNLGTLQQVAGLESSLANQSSSECHLPLSSSNIVLLQQTIGNQAVNQLLTSNHVQKKLNLTAVVQRDPLDSFETPIGNTYELLIPQIQGERWSFSGTISISRPKPNPTKQESNGSSYQWFDSKGSGGAKKTYKAGGFKWGHSMAIAGAKQSVLIAEWIPGVKFKIETKELEAKLEAKEVDIDLFKLAMVAEGHLTPRIQGNPLGDEILATDLGEPIRKGALVKLQMKFEIKIDPSDAVRLARLVKLNSNVAKNAKIIADAAKKQHLLKSQSRRLRKDLQGFSRKSPRYKLLARQLEENTSKVSKLNKVIKNCNKANSAIRKMYKEIAEGLTTKAGRLVGETVKRVGGKALQKAFSAIIPGVNILLGFLDIIEVIDAIDKLATGRAQFGFGEDSDQTKEGEADHNDVSTNRESSNSDRSSLPDMSEGSTKVEPEINISEETSYQPITGSNSGNNRAKPELHPAAAAVLNVVKSKIDGAKFTFEDLSQLNDLIPTDLTSEELQTILDELQVNQGKKAQDAYTILGVIHEYISRLRSQAPIPAVSTEESATGSIERDTQRNKQGTNESNTSKQKQIQEFINRVRGMVPASGIYVEFQDKLTGKEIKKGIVIRGLIALRGKTSQLYAGIATTIVVNVFLKQGKYEGYVLRTMLYDESGHPFGYVQVPQNTWTIVEGGRKSSK